MTTKVQITELNNNGDGRGFSFMAPAEALAFVGRMADVHLASMKPGAVRGNHYHLQRREAIVCYLEQSGPSIGTRATDRLLNIASLMAAAPCWCWYLRMLLVRSGMTGTAFCGGWQFPLKPMIRRRASPARWCEVRRRER